MTRLRVEVGGPVGLHARPAADFVRVAEQYQSKVWLTKDGMRVNGKSILAILTLAAERGSQVLIETDGPDEKEALEVLRTKVENSDT